MAPRSNGRRSLLLLALGGVHLAGGIEQEAPILDVTASKYDTRSGTAVDDYKGCYDNGCEPALLIDGILNDVKQSRWSCEIALVGSTEECYVTFDLGETLTLTKIVLYFRESNDTTRTANDFIVSTSLTDVDYTVAFSGVNTLGTELMVGEEFDFPALSSGRYVRLEGDLAVDEWMSVNEAILYHEVDTTPAPTPGSSTTLPAPTLGSSTTPPTPTPGSSTTPTAAPAEIYVDSDSIFPTAAPTPVAVATSGPTAGGTSVGGEECMSVTLSGAGDLNGEFVSTTTTTSTATASSSGEVAFVSAADNATVMSQGETAATCSDSSTNCMTNMWKIATNDVASFVVYDEAAHPSLVEELWISIGDCSTGSCQNSPADLSIVCGDGSASLAPTPAPVATDASVCGVVQVTGTSENAIDGLYYDDGTDATTGVSQYNGYDVDGTSNGNTVLAKSVDGACSSSSSSGASVAATASSDCLFRQWWVAPQASTGTTTATSYFTYDEADHPADMQEGGLWYTSTDEVLPYAEEVVITCAPATTPTLSPDVTSGAPVETPSSSSTSRGVPTADDNTRGPVSSPPVSSSTVSPAESESDLSGQSSEGGGSGETAVIVGGVVGGVALLAILGAVAYKMKKATPPPPPPSYDDLVGA